MIRILASAIAGICSSLVPVAAGKARRPGRGSGTKRRCVALDGRMNERLPALCYVDDSRPGITRKRRGRYWQYFDAEGKRVTDRDEIDRLNGIGLPPAYRDAWFCPDPDGHIQAIGYDDRGRKQYRYHTGFRERQEAAKFERCRDFGKVLP